LKVILRNTNAPINLEYQPMEAVRPSLLTSSFLNLHPKWVMMQVDIKNIFNIFFELLFVESYKMPRDLWQAVSPLLRCYGAHFSFYYQHGQHEKKVTIIESFSSTK